MTRVEFPLLRIPGISSAHLTGWVDQSGQVYICRKFVQRISGSAPMKVAGQIISIKSKYPRAKIIIDMSEAEISDEQKETVKLHVGYLNRGGFVSTVEVHFLDGEKYPSPPNRTGLSQLISLS